MNTGLAEPESTFAQSGWFKVELRGGVQETALWAPHNEASPTSHLGLEQNSRQG